MAEAERPKPGTRAGYRVFTAHPTRWKDNDVYGHINNTVHYQFFDTAVSGWLMERGLVVPGRTGCIGLVVETGCRYFAEMAYPDTVHAGLRVAKVGTSSVRFEIGLFRNDDDVAAAEGHFVHVYVDAATRRPMPMPDPMRAALAGLMPG
jgi:acyl-CoA thioester hydrolase